MKSLKEKSFGLFLFYVTSLLSYRINWISQKFCAKQMKISAKPPLYTSTVIESHETTH
jgi:hypothetical protein